MFTEMGWLDASLNFDNITAETDVLSLPANVSINTTFQAVYKEIKGDLTLPLSTLLLHENRPVTQKEEKNQSSNLLADFRLPACKLQVWYTQLSVQVYCLACPTQAARN